MTRGLTKGICWLLVISIAAGPIGCRNPAQSTLPPSAIAPPGTPLAPLPKGDMYADETGISPDALIEPGDTMDIRVWRGAGEEQYSSLVREGGLIGVAFLEIEVAGLTVAEAEGRIREKLVPYMRNPRVQVQLKKRVVKLKRVFVLGDVKKPGVHPMSKQMTVLNAIMLADSYNETAVLEEVRVIRGGLQRPEILTADIARMLTYGDGTRNLPLEENDIVFVPRERLGDASEAAKKVLPFVGLLMVPLQAAWLYPAYYSIFK